MPRSMRLVWKRWVKRSLLVIQSFVIFSPQECAPSNITNIAGTKIKKGISPSYDSESLSNVPQCGEDYCFVAVGGECTYINSIYTKCTDQIACDKELVPTSDDFRKRRQAISLDFEQLICPVLSCIDRKVIGNEWSTPDHARACPYLKSIADSATPSIG